MAWAGPPFPSYDLFPQQLGKCLSYKQPSRHDYHQCCKPKARVWCRGESRWTPPVKVPLAFHSCFREAASTLHFLELPLVSTSIQTQVRHFLKSPARAGSSLFRRKPHISWEGLRYPLPVNDGSHVGLQHLNRQKCRWQGGSGYITFKLAFSSCSPLTLMAAWLFCRSNFKFRCSTSSFLLSKSSLIFSNCSFKSKTFQRNKWR